MDFSGKHIVVSGGGSGSGVAIARHFAKAGGAVTILGRNRANLDQVAVACGATPLICDVTERPSIDAALNQARAQNGPVDIAVANAGTASSQPFGTMSEQDLDTLLDVNLKGVFHLWQACLPDMIQSRSGRLIAIASTAGLKGYAYVTGYSAAKHGVLGLMRSLARELGATGITCNAICPGFMETPMLERSIETITEKTGMTADAARESLRAHNPQNRFIQVAEVAAATLWLASDGARGVTGHALPISGGEV